MFKPVLLTSILKLILERLLAEKSKYVNESQNLSKVSKLLHCQNSPVMKYNSINE